VGHNDVLIKIHRSAICGTDMQLYILDDAGAEKRAVPMAVGHEYAGEIVRWQRGARLHNGDRVSGEGLSPAVIVELSPGRRHLCRNTSASR